MSISLDKKIVCSGFASLQALEMLARTPQARAERVASREGKDEWVQCGEDLISTARELARRSNGVEADLLLYLSEIDARKIYRERASPSMIAFCMREFNFSEGAAFNRITVARAARKIPAMLDALRSGAVHLTGLRLREARGLRARRRTLHLRRRTRQPVSGDGLPGVRSRRGIRANSRARCQNEPPPVPRAQPTIGGATVRSKVHGTATPRPERGEDSRA